MHIHQDRGRPLGVHQLHAAIKNTLGRGLYGHVDRQFQRLVAIGRIAQIIVKVFLCSRDADHLGGMNALAAIAGPAHDMRGKRPIGVKAHITRREQQARLADIMHGLHLLRADFLLDPQELALAGKVAQQAFFVQVRKHGHQLFHGPLRVDHVVRLRIKRMCLKIGRQQIAIAIHNIGAGGRDHGTGGRRARLCRVGGRHDPHTRAHNGEGAEEEDPQNQQSPLGALPRGVAHLLVADTLVFALDRVGVFALLTGFKNTGQRAQWGADHSGASIEDTSTPSVISNSGSSGSGG